jgi:putative hemolysin
MELITTSDIKRATRIKGWLANGAANMVMSAFKFNHINNLYARNQNKKGFDFVRGILNDTEIQYNLSTPDIDKVPAKGGFIMVANHPYGGVEGLILLDALKNKRPDLMIMANFLFHRIEPLKPFIFPVNPFEKHKDAVSSTQALMQALDHLASGKPLLIFPAGEVSTWYPGTNAIADRKWSLSAVKLIRKASVPVIPVFFSGTNSPVFHLLGLINPNLRTAQIPAEMLNKRNKPVSVRIGMPVSVQTLQSFTSSHIAGRYIRALVYALGNTLDVKAFFENPNKISAEEIAPAIDSKLLMYDINQLPNESLLFTLKEFSVYCAPAYQLPNVLKEIGRLREITFRQIGEGTNKKTDLDEYDLYYKHLFIWDNQFEQVVGAYRIGEGNQIMHRYGSKGFYIRSLFKFKKPFNDILQSSLELGRSFIMPQYQRNPLSLYMLWKGILHYLFINPSYRYLIGPVSISNKFTNLSKSLITHYIEQNHFNTEIAQWVKARKKFRPQLPPIDPEAITSATTDLISLDKLIATLEPDESKVPILLKKYLQLNGKIVCFNIDPLFNNALDGLLVLDIQNIPDEVLKMLSKETNK